MTQFLKRLLPVFFLILAFFRPFAQSKLPFADEIQSFKREDSIKFPESKAILFVGSSSFRKWIDIQSYFPGYKIINRGFGGSSLPDLINYVDDIIFPYRPKQIVIYCGDNDLAASDTVSAQMVFSRFKELYMLIRARLPATSIVFISIKPSPAREKLLPKIKTANSLIRKYLKRSRNTSYVNVYNKMVSQEGIPRKELFTEDDLHMNSKGYALWQKILRPYLLKD